ncbi:MAG TPA: LppX_LprAFG lipoprotein [Sporichthyaceae bacterium]|jgi:hypothetical protein|nr:LppX_LprAFG lipoprotein [Sporichthyaceae bacterium]
MHRTVTIVAGLGGLALVSVCGSVTSAAPPTVSAANLSPLAAVTKVAESARTTRSASYTLTVSGPSGMAMSGHGSYSTTPTAMDMVFDSASVAGLGQMKGMEERLVGDTVYLKLPMLSSLTGGKWFKLSLSKAGTSSGLDLGSIFQQSSATDPGQQLQALLSAPNVHQVGAETIDGVPTTHYAGDVTVADIEKHSGYDAATKASLAKLYANSGGRVTHLDVWVDSDYRARKFSATTPTPVGAATVTMTFSDYGKAVSVVAPAPGDVADLSGSIGSNLIPHAPGAPATAAF